MSYFRQLKSTSKRKYVRDCDRLEQLKFQATQKCHRPVLPHGAGDRRPDLSSHTSPARQHWPSIKVQIFVAITYNDQKLSQIL